MMKNDGWSALEELWKHKKLFGITCAVALLCSLVVSLSIPRQFVSRIKVSPETKFLELEVGAPKAGRLAGLLKDNSKWTTTGPDLYIEILHTTDFRNMVKQLHIATGDGGFKGTYEEYLKTYADYPWFYNLFFEHTIDDIVDSNVKYALNRGNATITIQVRSCDPYLSATMPDMIRELLEKKITERYHQLYKNMAKTYKANLDDALAKFHAKMDEYSRFKDSHEGVEDKTYMTVQTALQAEARKEKTACEKLRELKERCEMLSVKQDRYLTILVNSQMPRSASNPHYIANALIWLFYTIIFTSLFILYLKKIQLMRGKEEICNG